MNYVVTKQYGEKGYPVGTVVDRFSSDDMTYNDFAPYGSAMKAGLLSDIVEEVEQRALYKYVEKEYL